MLRDGTVGCEETLGRPQRLESLHASLSLPRRLVGVFRPVVQIAMLPMLNAGQALVYGGTVVSQLIGDDDSWNVREIFEPLAEELFLLQTLGDDRAVIETYVAGRPAKSAQMD